MDIRIGTSGWSFYDKENLFFPKELKSKDKLEFFSSILSTVEVNTTFYHFPRQTTIEKWYKETPEDFKFIIKLNRLFTHQKKLMVDEETKKRLKDFLGLAEGLKAKLGGLLIQLPASIKVDLKLLEDFLKTINKLKNKQTYRLFLEVRDKSWVEEEQFTPLLEKYNTSLVYSDGPAKWPQLLAEEENFYFRLHGRDKLYYSSYSHKELKDLLNLLKDKDFKDGYIFFNNTAGSGGIENALYLKELIKCDII